MAELKSQKMEVYEKKEKPSTQTCWVCKRRHGADCGHYGHDVDHHSEVVCDYFEQRYEGI